MMVDIIDMILHFKNNTVGDSIYLFIVMCSILFIYCLFTYKQNRDFIYIVNQVDTMSKGELNQTIEIESKGQIGNLANNINNMVTKLRNITIEERKAQQTKTDLITNVSHDLRTPLTSILGYLGLIEDDKYKDEVELRYYINIAYEKSKNLNILINDLFELTKMQNNTINIDKMEVNLVELLSQIIEHFSYQFRMDNLECRPKFSNDKLIVEIDANKMVRAFENLINNAIKYGKDGHYIDIETQRENDMAIIKFINYGEPISQLDIPHLFDRFYRVEKSRNKNSGGSGLGLAITKNIIELHEGQISVSSDEKLTLFEIKLPLI
ncbi:MAG: HAMP domain-containing sensor histidine kinase [Peptostreptococcaceae bacterium]